MRPLRVANFRLYLHEYDKDIQGDVLLTAHLLQVPQEALQTKLELATKYSTRERARMFDNPLRVRHDRENAHGHRV